MPLRHLVGQIAKVTLYFLGMALIAAAMPLAAQDFRSLVSFDSFNGDRPQTPPVQAVDGNLYGVTFAGGANLAGAVYKLTPNGALTILYSFCSLPGCADGKYGSDSIVPGADGNLYGLTVNGGSADSGIVFKLTLQGQFSTIYNFCSQPNCADGSAPNGLLLASDGNFYGTTMTGGAHQVGTIFKLTPQGVLTLLHTFCSQPGCADGYDIDNSFGTLTQGTDGNFYGVTDRGGSEARVCSHGGCGTAYQITPEGKFKTLYTFCSELDCADGANPNWLFQAADGFFYGATAISGRNLPQGGTLFRLTPQGNLATLYHFCVQSACANGDEPVWLLQASSGGPFYGATLRGGASTKCPDGCGTLFELAGGKPVVLHSFDGFDGAFPFSMTQATNGIFYGITAGGGSDQLGTLFSWSAGLVPFVECLPCTAKAGAKIAILGTDLTRSTAVSFNGMSAAFTVISATEIAAEVPPEAKAGYITVTTPAGTLASSVSFRVTP